MAFFALLALFILPFQTASSTDGVINMTRSFGMGIVAKSMPFTSHLTTKRCVNVNSQSM